VTLQPRRPTPSPATGMGAGAARMLGPMRVRLAALILVAAVPLLLLAGTIAWQNYSLALAVSAQQVDRLRESAVARHEAAIDGASQMLAALAQAPELISDPDQCHDRLASVLSLQTSRYSNISLFDAAGHLYCLAHALSSAHSIASVEAANRPLFQAAMASNALVLGPVRQSDIVHGPIIPAVAPVFRQGELVGYLYAGLRMDWFTGTQRGALPALTALWLVDPAGHVTAVAEANDSNLPPPPALKQLLASNGIAQARATNGMAYVYAASVLGQGYSMIVGYASGADEATARSVLITRALQLALFLLLGLAAVAIGTHRALVAPMNELGQAVETWRRTGIFNAAIQSPPREVAALAASFNDAVGALAEQKTQLTAAVEKQDLLMKEIHHRVKNNLQIVASLLNLQASRIRVPAARAEFQSARDRVRALATLHRHLYSQGELTTISMREFLTELCGQIFDAMGERQGGRIQLTIEATELEMNGDQAVPLSLVVTEAVSNAVKYAFPNGRTGHVEVRLTTTPHTARLTIRDDGIGIPAGRAETESGTRDGLGLQLIKGFSKQLGAVLTVHQGEGTSYELEIPLKEPNPPTT
jgi:two-component sensor histidine kinase